MNNITLVKVGGKIVENETDLHQLLADFNTIEDGKVLVHGGGRLATSFAAKLGIESQMVDGRRITDKAMLDVVTMVYAGLVNKTIVAQLQALRVNAIGLTGADMNMIRSVKRPVATTDFGYVGDVEKVNLDALVLLLKNGFVPVFSPLTHDRQGQILNTNADTIAAEVAKVLAKLYNVTLIFCFEKSGVLSDENNENTVIPEINRDLYKQYKEEGIIKGGMIPKLDNAFAAIDAGVKRVIITKASEINAGRGTVVY